MKIFDWFKNKVTNKECIWQTYKIVTLYMEVEHADCYDIEIYTKNTTQSLNYLKIIWAVVGLK